MATTVPRRDVLDVTDEKGLSRKLAGERWCYIELIHRMHLERSYPVHHAPIPSCSETVTIVKVKCNPLVAGQPGPLGDTVSEAARVRDEGAWDSGDGEAALHRGLHGALHVRRAHRISDRLQTKPCRVPGLHFKEILRAPRRTDRPRTFGLRRPVDRGPRLEPQWPKPYRRAHDRAHCDPSLPPFPDPPPWKSTPWPEQPGLRVEREFRSAVFDQIDDSTACRSHNRPAGSHRLEDHRRARVKHY